MKLKNYIKLIFVLAVFLAADGVFSMPGKIRNNDISTFSGGISNDILTIYKKREKGLDVYTFTPEKKADKEVISAIENRLKVLIDGFVSFSVDKKNEVKIVTDPSKISEEGLKQTIAIIVPIYEYYPTNYKIEKL